MPLGESMITVLRNNNMLLRAKKRFKNTFNKVNTHEESLYNLPKATPELLERIRLKMKVEQQNQTIVYLVVFITLLVLVVLTIS